MLIYFVLYILAFTGYLIKANDSKKNKKIYLVLMFALLIGVSAVRSQTVGTDMALYYSKYYPQFGETAWPEIRNVTMYNNEWEWGYCALCKLLNYISPDVQLLIFVTSILEILPFAIFIYKNSEDVVFSTSVFIGFHIYAQSFNIVRQMIAVGIILMGMDLLKKKKYVLFAGVVLIAMLFHSSAFIAVLFIVLDKIKYSKGKMYLIFLATGVIAVGYRLIVDKLVSSLRILSDFSQYSSSGNRDSGGYITIHTAGMFLIMFLAFLVCYMYLNQPVKNRLPDEITIKEYKKITLNGGVLSREDISLSEPMYWKEESIMLFVYMGTLFRFSAFILNVSSRFALYFIPFMLISVPHSANKISNTKGKYLVYSVMYLLITAFFVYITIFKANSLWRAVPYTTFF